MDVRKIIKHHKWFGLFLGFFLVMFCISGVLLNHRHFIKNCNVSRSLLPSRYEYHNWNGGLLRGSIRVAQGTLVYGSSGVFLYDMTSQEFHDFNAGMPTGADYRQIRNVITSGSQLFAVSPFALYKYGEHGRWYMLELPLDNDEKLTDIASHGDTLVVMSRSFVYTTCPPYKYFKKIGLPQPYKFDNRPTAFRTMWMLHSGEYFGKYGKLVIDMAALIIIVLCLTGVVFWIMKKWRKLRRPAIMKTSLYWHDRIGSATLLLTLFVCATGWCLRPPMMIALALNRLPAMPGSLLSSNNPWNDKLRMIRHDNKSGEWIISSSEGFYSLGSSISCAHPKKLYGTPPVSVMGLNVWQQDQHGRWLCGSFSGMFVWDRDKNISTDFLTGKTAPKSSGAPFGKTAVAGFTDDQTLYGDNKNISKNGVVVEYDGGTTTIAQPEWMNKLPMSLWNVALEIHSGRIYIGNIATYIFIFVMGAGAVWCLWTGYRIRKKRQ